MYSIHVFAQHKVLFDALTRLGPDQQAAIDRAFLGGDWTRDTNGNLLSALSPVLMPGHDQAHLAVDVPFTWPDSGTRGLVNDVAFPQLLVCEVHGVAERGDLQMHIHGVFGGEDGEALEVFEGVPRTAVFEAQRQMQSAVGQTGAQVPAYRVVPVGEIIRAVEVQRVVRRRDKRIQKVRSVDVYELRLERFGPQARVIVNRRATLREAGRFAPPQSLLAGRITAPLVLHALTGVAAVPYGVLKDTPIREASKEALAWLQKLTVRPEPPAPPAPPTRDVTSPRVTTEPAGGAGPVLKPAVREEPPATSPERTGHTVEEERLVRSPEQAAVDEGPDPVPSVVPGLSPDAGLSGAVTPGPVADPWSTLPDRMAVDPLIVNVARVTLERARPLLLTGSPGVGKTLLATLLAEAMCGEGNYTLVTADARWTSTEVLGGLGVIPGSALRYAFRPGVVTRAALKHRESLQRTGRPHALIIDEFNRAHQDEAFGRLLTLLDPRYRTQLPLVDPVDGADEAAFLPEDFLLIGTLNDADTGRLHDLSAALRRRFTTLHVRVPASERTHLTRTFASLPAGTLDTLYALVGDGTPGDHAAGRVRASVPLGTHFMTEVLEYVLSGLTLDTALSVTLPDHWSALTGEALTRVGEVAARCGLPEVQAAAERAALDAAF